MTGLTLDVSPGYLVDGCASLQTFALGFFFVPLQSAAYLYLPREQINNATGMVSMLRNEGASLGVAMLTTLLARRDQFHQMRLGSHINSLSHATAEALNQASLLAQHAGADPGLARQQGTAMLYNQLQRQAMMLSYLDALMLFSVMALAVIPLVFLMRRSVAKDPVLVPE